MSSDITLEILPNGKLRFKRGDKKHNEEMMKILSDIIDEPKVLKELTEFFKGSEDVELVVGDTIFCG